MQSTILFISHEASRTGAPMVLLHILKWLKLNTNIRFTILVKKRGVLLGEFEKLAPTYVYDFDFRPLHGLKGKFIGNWDTYIGIPAHFTKLKNIINSQSIKLIYSNTILNGDILEFLSFLNCKVITHVHELEIGIYFKGLLNLQQIKSYTYHYIAASQAVKKNLVLKHNVNENNVDIIHECIEVTTNLNDTGGLLKRDYNLPSDAFIVGASGTIDLRKGFDLFLHLIFEINKIKTASNIFFVWIGGDENSDLLYIIKSDLAKLKLDKKVIFIASTPEPAKYFFDFDVFVMMSREDPYPLVCLENALLGKPILCFDQSGGMPEFVENDCGFVVPYLDIQAMAARIIDLQASPKLKTQLGNNARQKVALQHDVNVTAPKIADIIYGLCNEVKAD